MVFITPDNSTEVVAAIDIILHPRETAVIAYVYLGATIDVGIAGTSEGVIDAAIAQIDIRVAKDVPLTTATVYILCLRNGQTVCFLFRVTGIDTIQVDRSLVGGVIDVVALAVFLTDDTFLTASENLEGVAVDVVHGGAAPYLGVLTFTRTKHGHGYRLHVVALCLAEHTGVALATFFHLIGVLAVCLRKDNIFL